MLKTIELPDTSGTKVVNDNGKVVTFSISGSGVKLAKKLEKLKDQKLSKFQKTRLSKKISKSGNLSKFDAKQI